MPVAGGWALNPPSPSGSLADAIRAQADALEVQAGALRAHADEVERHGLQPRGLQYVTLSDAGALTGVARRRIARAARASEISAITAGRSLRVELGSLYAWAACLSRATSPMRVAAAKGRPDADPLEVAVRRARQRRGRAAND